jgi:hypothetical protein
VALAGGTQDIDEETAKVLQYVSAQIRVFVSERSKLLQNVSA